MSNNISSLMKNAHKPLKGHKKNAKVDWSKTSQYREAVLLKVLRAMKSYGYSEWMSEDLKALGISL